MPITLELIKTFGDKPHFSRETATFTNQDGSIYICVYGNGHIILSRGITPNAIATIPLLRSDPWNNNTLVIADNQLISNVIKTKIHHVYNNDDCSICLDPLKEQPCIKLTKCGHVHHRKCITKWFKIEKTCPLCRTIVLTL